MTFKDIINSIEPIEYSRYASVSSNEKLCIYASYYLETHNVPLSFNYICIATFKMFPDKFCVDEEFPEFPSVDRLNRTVLHCVKPSNAKNRLLIGDVRLGYTMTKMGILVAKQVEMEINGHHEEVVKKKPVDDYKKGYLNDYQKFIKSDSYRIYVASKEIDLFYVWDYFEVFPYTEVDRIKKTLKNIGIAAKEKNDLICIELVNEIIRRI